jgi:ABC-2 type transport system ATP-binding protein
VRRRIGYLPQTPALNDHDTCRQALEFLADLKGVDRRGVGRLLERVNLAAHADTRVGRLSGGMRQRLALAAALLADPPLLLLDEPAASLDVESRRELHELVAQLRDEGRAVVLSTHLLDRIDTLVDGVIVLVEGRVAFTGTMEELADRARKRRYVVSLNGTAPAAFSRALEAAGIGPERVRRAEPEWEELLLSLSGERRKEETS